MTVATQFKNIKTLIQTGSGRYSRLFSFAGLGIGVLLLLSSVQMFINIQKLLRQGPAKKSGYDFISITKTITNETMGQVEKNLFSAEEIKLIRAHPLIEDVSPLIASQFRMQLSAGEVIPFRTDLFLETLDDDFIDTVPPSFRWQPGQNHIPIILSSDFLEIYNIFAPAQGLPQISQESAGSVGIFITCYGNGLEETFTGNVVAFSDRINSVIVPKTFLLWANTTFGGVQPETAPRLFIKTKDANNPELLRFFDKNNYRVNKDRTKFGRVRQTLQGVFSGLAFFGIMVVLLAMMLFSFYLQLVIARSKENLQMLLILGYSPRWLAQRVAKRFVPVYIIVILLALVSTAIMQWAFHRFAMYNRPELSSWPHWIVAAAAAILIIFSVIINYRLIHRMVNKLF